MTTSTTPPSSGRLPDPTVEQPTLYGAPVAPGETLPWEWARDRLHASRNYWVTTVRPDGRPHVRPIWGLWEPSGLWFCTGSGAIRNLRANPETSVNLEDGNAVVILEGTTERIVTRDLLETFCSRYDGKYHHGMRVEGDVLVDGSGAEGPAYHFVPRVGFGWDHGMASPTRWSFH